MSKVGTGISGFCVATSSRARWGRATPWSVEKRYFAAILET